MISSFLVLYDAAMNCCDKKEGQKISWWWCLGLIPIALIIIWGLKIPLGSLLPWGVFLLCPLMHIFMMKGHDNHEGHKEQGGHCEHEGHHPEEHKNEQKDKEEKE